jgi:hypothetical protein
MVDPAAIDAELLQFWRYTPVEIATNYRSTCFGKRRYGSSPKETYKS